MNFDDFADYLMEDGGAGAPASGPGSGVASDGSAGATTEDNVAYLPSKLGTVRPVCKGRKRKCRGAQTKMKESDGLPEVQQVVLDKYGPALVGDMKRRAQMSAEPFVKFWLLNDGTFIHVDRGHLEGILGSRYDSLLDSGAIRVSSDPGKELSLEYRKQPNMDQILALKYLAELHDTDEVVIEAPDNVSSDLSKRGEVIPLRSPKELPDILRGKVRHKSLAAQFHESIIQEAEDTMLKLREDLKPALTALFDGDPFHLLEKDALLWKSRFGVDTYLTGNAPLVSVENKVRGVQKLVGTLLQKYGKDRGYLEMLIDAMNEREPLNSFDGFKSHDYIYGTRMRSSHEGIEMVFEAALDPLYTVSETIYVNDVDVLDRWEELARGIKRVGNTVFPKGERFSPGLLKLLEHAIIDTIDVEDHEDQEEMDDA